MMEMCGFEILVRGDSPWCKVFTREEWLDFICSRLAAFLPRRTREQVLRRDGLALAKCNTRFDISGTHWRRLLQFVHDGDIIPVLAALGIYSGHNPLQRERN